MQGNVAVSMDVLQKSILETIRVQGPKGIDKQDLRKLILHTNTVSDPLVYGRAINSLRRQSLAHKVDNRWYLAEFEPVQKQHRKRTDKTRASGTIASVEIDGDLKVVVFLKGEEHMILRGSQIKLEVIG